MRVLLKMAEPLSRSLPIICSSALYKYVLFNLETLRPLYRFFVARIEPPPPPPLISLYISPHCGYPFIRLKRAIILTIFSYISLIESHAGFPFVYAYLVISLREFHSGIQNHSPFAMCNKCLLLIPFVFLPLTSNPSWILHNFLCNEHVRN